MAAGRALEGLLVVALEQAVAAPLCTARLAQAGARVIKIERAGGDLARGYDHVVHGESAYFAWLNCGKQSIVLDIKDEGDAALLHRMLRKADVFVQNLLPGAAARAGFGSAELRAADPQLITCDISGYGEDGPLAAMKAYDFLIQCESGLASITGSEQEAGRVGVSVADIACGMNAHAGILQALFNRERTGGGAGLSVSLFDGMADWMAVPLLQQDYGGQGPKRLGLNHATIAPYGAYGSGDGKQVVIAVQNEREWAGFCRHVLKKPKMANDPRFDGNVMRCLNRTALDDEINGALGGQPLDEIVKRLADGKIAYGRVNGTAELSRHEQLRRTTVASPTGPIALPAPPVRWSSAPTSSGPVPNLDEHGPALRAEFA
jgi:crotonobetainyl-CoA:carnitine CoA-transferase CaiB-like acyl-CoA transferase